MFNPLLMLNLARLPVPEDNAAIALRRLEAGERVELPDGSVTLPHTILEGHRFAVRSIRAGEPLLSWGLPFGLARTQISPGDYLCNEKILLTFAERRVGFHYPSVPNFSDHRVSFVFDETTFQPGQQVCAAESPRSFQGFLREGTRGAGTRNYVVVLGTTARTGSHAKSIAQQFKNVRASFPNIDGVVAIAHTEAAGPNHPNNFETTLRTLEGFLLNSNVAAFVALDLGMEPLTNAHLLNSLSHRKNLLDSIPHHFLTLDGNLSQGLARAAEAVAALLPQANACRRTVVSLRHLKIGLQCGGSDAFNGISANPLIGWIAKETLRHGGVANLCETDELIGAEPDILSNVRDVSTAYAFLRHRDQFQAWAHRHGHSADGNPSGGNLFRGLYNISIKSIGAARKRDPSVRLDYVIDFSEPMPEAGFYFMNSPGNDLESISGQVASGCNLILFATGNGSITNFPFVPTLKVMSTTNQFRGLSREMDFNAGRFLDGEPINALGAEAFEFAVEVASGRSSAGEKAGHSQVQLWRDWHLSLNSSSTNDTEGTAFFPAAVPPPLAGSVDVRRVCDWGVYLIVPTSLCSGQVAQKMVERFNKETSSYRFVTLPHTEGCGVSGGECERLLLSAMTGYLVHPGVRRALLLEHGCEKTHIDSFRNFMTTRSLDFASLGTASIQRDGGLERVTEKVRDWFDKTSDRSSSQSGICSSSFLRVGLLIPAHLDPHQGSRVREFIETLTASGVVVCPVETPWLDPLTTNPLDYGQPFSLPGLHFMHCPTQQPIEILSGLGATGVDVLVLFSDSHAWPAHPFIPTLQIGFTMEEGFDADFSHTNEEWLARVTEAAAGRMLPAMQARHQVSFQITRGYTGVSL